MSSQTVNGFSVSLCETTNMGSVMGLD